MIESDGVLSQYMGNGWDVLIPVAAFGFSQRTSVCLVVRVEQDGGAVWEHSPPIYPYCPVNVLQLTEPKRF